MSPLTTECPVCGIQLSREPLKRPLLFQFSKAIGKSKQKYLDNVTPVSVENDSLPDSTPTQTEPPVAALDVEQNDAVSKVVSREDQFFELAAKSTFWRLVRMELLDAIILFIINTFMTTVVCWQLKLSPGTAYADYWSFLIPFHLLVSWSYFMLPILLSGSSIAMLIVGFGIADAQPEKRLSFSLFMLISVVLVPFSFLCMALSPAHITMAELLTGQEIRERIPNLARRG
ncbi:MAG: hypothetical protein FWG02_06030 [Holophagaceae bacterium]|nr:hypothetical protein [Holophagaceae bacterium]